MIIAAFSVSALALLLLSHGGAMTYEEHKRSDDLILTVIYGFGALVCAFLAGHFS